MVEPLKRFLSNAGVYSPAFRNKPRIFQAGRGRDQGGDGHEVPTGAVHDFFHEVRTRDSESAAQSSHAVSFGESAEHYHILGRLHQIERRWSIAEMNVRFIDHYDRTFGFVFDAVFDIGM